MKRQVTITITALAVAALAGRGGSPRHHHTVAAQAQASSASPSCHDQAAAWRDSADTQMTALIHALGKASKAGTDLGKAQAAATRLRTTAQALLSNLPPACVTGARADFATAMHDLIAAADSIDQGTTTSLGNADQQINAGSAAFVRATKDLKVVLP